MNELIEITFLFELVLISDQSLVIRSVCFKNVFVVLCEGMNGYLELNY